MPHMVLDGRPVRALGFEEEHAARAALDGTRVHHIVLVDILRIFLVQVLVQVLDLIVVVVFLIFVVLAASAATTHSS